MAIYVGICCELEICSDLVCMYDNSKQINIMNFSD